MDIRYSPVKIKNNKQRMISNMKPIKVKGKRFIQTSLKSSTSLIKKKYYGSRILKNKQKGGSREINWLCRPSDKTIKDAWETWNLLRVKINPQLIPTFSSFKKLLEKSKCITKNISDVEPMENTRLEKYRHATTAEEAYPPNDRPRGQKDIDSVNYHIKTQEPISPIIVISVNDLDNKNHLIMLDGVHRIMGALIRKSKVSICYINALK